MCELLKDVASIVKVFGLALLGRLTLELDSLIDHLDPDRHARAQRIHDSVMDKIRQSGTPISVRWDFDDAPQTPRNVLDDPCMDGKTWNDAADVTQDMLRSWPGLWETNTNPHLFKTTSRAEYILLAPIAHGLLARQDTYTKWRPLRLPGMGPDGVVAAKDMTYEHWGRCEWTGREYEDEPFAHISARDAEGWHPDSQFRPVGWPYIDNNNDQ